MQNFKKYKPYSIRLKHYNYSETGEYFITICTKDMISYFGVINENHKMILSNIGEIAEKYWLEIPQHFPNVELDIYQIMPNHLHGIIRILFSGGEPDPDCRDAIHRVSKDNKTGGFAGSKNPMLNPNSLSKIINWFKGRTTFEVNKILKDEGIINKKDAINRVSTGFKFQPNYYEQIIKNEKHYSEVYTYIESNPQTWDRDRNNPKNIEL